MSPLATSNVASSVVPLWDRPWWHHDWLQAQLEDINHPDLIDDRYCLKSSASANLRRPKPDQAPASQHQNYFEGVLRRPDCHSYIIEDADQAWPLITLE